jgi:outer membrane protein assembly factor BamB
MEDSAIIWRGRLIVSDNGGNLMCLNLNNLTLDWVQNVLDDTNCTPVLELENGHPYVYTSTSFHAGWRAPASATAAIPIWKIDALTGEIVWQTEYECYTESGVSGGTQGTLAIGKNKLSDMIFVPVAKTPLSSTGKLVALNKQTGEVVWEVQTQVYSWSSPVAVYDKDGNGYLVFCTTGGYMYLIDGLTGKVCDSLNVGGNVEASPAVYNNTVVVGTRTQLIWGINLT